MHKGEYNVAGGRRVMWHCGTKRTDRPRPTSARMELLTPDEPEGDAWYPPARL